MRNEYDITSFVQHRETTTESTHVIASKPDNSMYACMIIDRHGFSFHKTHITQSCSSHPDSHNVSSSRGFSTHSCNHEMRRVVSKYPNSDCCSYYRQQCREAVAEMFRGALQLYATGHHRREAPTVQELPQKSNDWYEFHRHGTVNNTVT